MWVFNVWLYLNFVFNPSGYQQWKSAGQPCYAYVASLADPAFPQNPNVQPTCWYDPTNLNSGVPQQ